jgi:hypothetical protein
MPGSRGSTQLVRCFCRPRAFTIQIVRALAMTLACACNHLAPAVPPPAPTGPSPAAAPPKVLALPEETMEFHATLRGIHVGIVQTAIGKPGWIGDRHAIIVKSRAKSDGLAALLGEVSWELETTIDLDGSYPIKDREDAWIDVAGEHEHHGESRTWQSGDAHHDVHSAIGVLRGWQSERGTRAEVRMRLGGGSFPLEVWNGGRELLEPSNKPAVRYDGNAHHEVPFSIWISDDAARVPLAFRAETPIGTIGIELVDYQIAN